MSLHLTPGTNEPAGSNPLNFPRKLPFEQPGERLSGRNLQPVSDVIYREFNGFQRFVAPGPWSYPSPALAGYRPLTPRALPHLSTRHDRLGSGRRPVGPGTTITSRPWSPARRAVISDPLCSRASTTTTAFDSPLMMRLRCGKWNSLGMRARQKLGHEQATAPRCARADPCFPLDTRGRCPSPARRWWCRHRRARRRARPNQCRGPNR